MGTGIPKPADSHANRGDVVGCSRHCAVMGNHRPSTDVGDDDEEFSVEVHHGGFFVGQGMNRAYVDKKINYFDHCAVDTWSPLWIDDFAFKLHYTKNPQLKAVAVAVKAVIVKMTLTLWIQTEVDAADDDLFVYNVDEQISDEGKKVGKGKNARGSRLKGLGGAGVDRADGDGDGDEVSTNEELELPDSDREGESSLRFKSFRVVDLANPIFKVGMMFETVELLRKAITKYSLKQRVEIKFPRNEKKRLKAHCEQDCPWNLYASVDSRSHGMMIKTYYGQHTCQKKWVLKRCTLRWLADKYLECFRSDQKMKLTNFGKTVQKEWNLTPSRSKLARARSLAMKSILGDEVEKYKLLWDYGSELKRSNPSSSFFLTLDNNIFSTLYVSLDACKRGFLGACRPIIFLDGCHIKKKFGGQILTIVGIDPNDCIYPVAMGIAEVESLASWKWFLQTLKEDLGIENTYPWTIMTDKQKGLIPVVQQSRKKVNKNASWAKTCYALPARQGIFQVQDRDYTFIMDIKLKKCNYRRWNLTSIPCSHAISCLRHERIPIDSVLSECYSSTRYLIAYGQPIWPCKDKATWEKVQAAEVLPPVYEKKVGRSPKSRRKQPHEVQGKNGPRLSKHGITITCRYCGESGHNKATCSMRKAGIRPKLQSQRNPTSQNEEHPADFVEMDDDGPIISQVAMHCEGDNMPLLSQLTSTMVSQMHSESSQVRSVDLGPLLDSTYIMSNQPETRPVPPTTTTKTGRARATKRKSEPTDKDGGAAKKKWRPRKKT